ncbi:hypothetical protein D1007_20486 [Hordeum vulgare]|nr:hypothetical protein D1007_20486 [Hordeum vulgare]
MENARNKLARKGPKLQRTNDPPARYDWVDFDNEIAADDDDLSEEWVDEKFEAKKKKKSKWEQDSDYDRDEDLEEMQDSDVEASDSAQEVEVVDKQGRKKMKKKVKLRRWGPEKTELGEELTHSFEFRYKIFTSFCGVRAYRAGRRAKG